MSKSCPIFYKVSEIRKIIFQYSKSIQNQGKIWTFGLTDHPDPSLSLGCPRVSTLVHIYWGTKVPCIRATIAASVVAAESTYSLHPTVIPTVRQECPAPSLSLGCPRVSTLVHIYWGTKVPCIHVKSVSKNN